MMDRCGHDHSRLAPRWPSVLGLLTALPASAAYQDPVIEFPGGTSVFYSPFSGPATVTFAFDADTIRRDVRAPPPPGRRPVHPHEGGVHRPRHDGVTARGRRSRGRRSPSGRRRRTRWPSIAAGTSRAARRASNCSRRWSRSRERSRTRSSPGSTTTSRTRRGSPTRSQAPSDPTIVRVYEARLAREVLRLPRLRA